MARSKVAVSLDSDILSEVDRWVSSGEYPSRSRVIEAGLKSLQRERVKQGSFLAELAKLDPDEERSLAEERLKGEVEWPNC